MEYYKRIQTLFSAVGKSVSSEENKGVFGITTCGGIVYSWHIVSISVVDILTWPLLFKAFSGLFMIFVAPPLGTFMNDVYKEKIRPKIFKRK